MNYIPSLRCKPGARRPQYRVLNQHRMEQNAERSTTVERQYSRVENRQLSARLAGTVGVKDTVLFVFSIQIFGELRLP